MGQKLIDETGNRYGFLTVLEKTKDKNGRTAWLCRCDCGNTKVVRGPVLRKGGATTCGRQCSLKYLRSNAIDETGKIFGRLTVLYRTPYKKGDKKSYWHCRCSCGNEKDVRQNDLENGAVKSCGCLLREKSSERAFKDEIGNKYGKLTVISLVSKSPKAIWRCRCDCGRWKDVSGIYLRSGNTKSCGCLLSWPEEEINQFLIENNVSFKRQYSFPDLIGDKKPLRFDFAILKNEKILGMIEYCGTQHYKKIEFYGGEEGFQKQSKYDQKKKEYLQKKKIPLLIINKNTENWRNVIMTYCSLWGEEAE